MTAHTLILASIGFKVKDDKAYKLLVAMKWKLQLILTFGCKFYLFS